jgi:hypothetical protein
LYGSLELIINEWMKKNTIHWIGGWVGPRVSLDVVENRKTLLLVGFEPQSSSP